jgi:SAM-dependent methyltransferase
MHENGNDARRYAYGARDNLDAMSLADNYNAHIFRWISEGVTEGMRVLDFGAGGGEFANRFDFPITCIEPDTTMQALIGQKTGIGHKTYRSLDELADADGVLKDVSREDAKNAKKFKGDQAFFAPSRETHRGAANNADGFDLIYSINVLEHIQDDLAVLRLLYKCLKDGGRLKVLVPAFKLLYGRMDEHVGHVRRYSRGALNALLKDAGFESAELCYFDSIGFFASLLYKLTGGRGDIDPADVSKYDRYVFPLSARLDEAFFKRALGKNLMAGAVKSRKA